MAIMQQADDNVPQQSMQTGDLRILFENRLFPRTGTDIRGELFLLCLLYTEPVLPLHATTDAPLLLRPRGPGEVKQAIQRSD